MSEEKPQDWGSDALSAFIDKAQANTLATFVRLRPAFVEAAKADAMVVEVLENGRYPPQFEMAGILMTKAVSNFRAGIALAAAGQLSEAQLMVRSILESGLYAPAIASSSDLSTTWQRREESAQTRDAARDAFAFNKLRRRFVEPIDTSLADALEDRYDRAIALGAHPNVGGVRSSSERREGEDHRRVNTEMLSGDLDEIAAALRDLTEAILIAAKTFALGIPPPVTPGSTQSPTTAGHAAGTKLT